ncbi:polyketide synthase [Streptomyces sp. RK75]|uniref:beta-ketoacyl [acyl carrier protein] synthase domain-containing protein n=1 Tax=Streptomyces sp. RK75 TaxID=2824895 RepID=UPI001FFDB300|nr:polyketide synthase [Streptomyces sp. RK75]
MTTPDEEQEQPAMHSGRGSSTDDDHGAFGSEPIAVVGIAALYPAARSVADYWRLHTDAAGEGDRETGRPAAGTSGTSTTTGTAGPPEAGYGSDSGSGSGSGLDDIEVDVARFGIPPAQAASMARMQLLMLEAARQCLDDAGYAQRPLPSERTDVVTGTCFGLDRQYANALRVEGSRYARDLERATAEAETPGPGGAGARAAEEFRSAMLRRLGASPHDRIGEMASTIPARVAAAFKLRGRTLAVESADATSYLGIAHAVDSLRCDLTDAALVLAGQCHEGRSASPVPGPSSGSAALPLSEGVGALLLKRLSSAVRDGDRVYATLVDCTLRQDAHPGVFRHSSSTPRQRETIDASWRRTGAPAASVQYVECAGGGVELLAGTYSGLLEAAPAPVAVGSVRDRLGDTYANAGLAGVSKVALALYHRRLPAQRAAVPGELPVSGTPLRTVVEAEDWQRPAGGGPRRAVVGGASVTGTLCHLVLQEYAQDDDRSQPPEPQRRGARLRWHGTGPEPIAVIGYGGRFADTADADAFWAAMLAGRDHIRPVPDALLDRELYHSPHALSLNRSYAEQGAPMPVPRTPPPGVRIPPGRYEALDAAQRVGLAVADELFARRGMAPGTLTGTGLVAVGSNLGLATERNAHTGRCLDVFEETVRSLGTLEGWSRDEVEPLLKSVRELYGEPGPADRPTMLDGCLASGVAALIANEYGLAAVPVAVEAACASSLAAVDMAVTRLRTGAADYALAGGVELPCNARDMILCSALGLLSHDKITPFDLAADGFTPGDGCALFLLKRLRDARRDGDRVLGLLRGVGASNDAKSLIAPDAAGQSRAMRQAFEQVDFAPAAVDYVEAHGTGTRVGDRVEVAAMAQVYSGPRRAPLEIGSAKSFFGHTFAAAGAAGLLRALLAVGARTLPPNANLRTLNPELELDLIPARVSTGAQPWHTGSGRPRRAGVSSFGTGGINYHLLLEEYTDSHGL